MEIQLQLAELIEAVAKKKGYRRSVVCSRDCLREWNRVGVGRKGRSYMVKLMHEWQQSLVGDSHSETERHGSWVPAIPV